MKQNSQIDKVYERINFYQLAYNNLQDDKKEKSKTKSSFTDDLLKHSQAFIHDKYGNDISEEERHDIENQYGYYFTDIDRKYDSKKSEFSNNINTIKENPSYKEYLQLSLDEDLELCLKLEDDETFMFLIKEKFNQINEFDNNPYVKIGPFIYQPRFWKFKKMANRVAKRHFIETYTRMFDLWFKLRMNYNSLEKSKMKIKSIIEQGEKFEGDIKTITEQIDNLVFKKAEEVYSELVKMFLYIDRNKIDDDNMRTLRIELDGIEEDIKKISDNMSKIMDNINKLEELIQAMERGYVLPDDKLDRLMSIDNPTIPIFEEIKLEDWNDIKQAFKDKGIELSDNKDDYSVVKTEITDSQKDYYLNKYNVKEGEIFIDENLVNKKY